MYQGSTGSVLKVREDVGFAMSDVGFYTEIKSKIANL